MPRPRDHLHPGFYIAVALTGIAAAYVLNQWLLHRRDARRPPRGPPDDTNKPSCPKSAPHHPDQDGSHPPPSTTSADPTVTTEPFVPVTSHPPSPLSNTDSPPPPTSQPNVLPPLLTQSLPPPLPTPHALTSPAASTGSFGTSGGPDGLVEQGAQDASSAEPFADLLSPLPTHVVSRRRSVIRAHDLFAASHISFSELGNLVALPDEQTHVEPNERSS